MRLGREQPSELRRLQDDFRELKAEARAQGEQLEEARAQEAAARAAAAQTRAELDSQRQHVQRHLTQARPSGQPTAPQLDFSNPKEAWHRAATTLSTLSKLSSFEERRM